MKINCCRKKKLNYLNITQLFLVYNQEILLCAYANALNIKPYMI